MGCWHEWADDSHLIMNIYIEAPWTWEEFTQDSNEVFGLLAQMGKPCATVVDVTRMGKLPPGNALSYIINVERIMPANVFASALVGAPYVIRGLMDIVVRVRPHARRIAVFPRTLSEAHVKIRQRYAELVQKGQV
jgi:hypothetical protein